MKKKTETKKVAAKATAKKVVVKKAANVLLERADKVVTKDKDSGYPASRTTGAFVGAACESSC